MASSSHINEAQFRIMANRLGGRFIRKVLAEIERDARLIAGTGPYSTGHRVELHPRMRPSLAASFYTIGPIPRGLKVDGRVGNRAPHAMIVHNGAGPHMIFARYTRSQRLYFYWKRRNIWFEGPYVSHPGMQGKHYLTRAGEMAGKRHRFRFVTYGISGGLS
jgi:hypothetical protein